MAESAFAYYRGTPAVMAFDLATTPRTDIVVQASGDAHISNFGLFASPERTLVFDSNDFDETLPGPWEWDVKRLAASVVIAGRANGFSAARVREATMGAVRGYRQWMARYAGMRLLDVWYASLTDADIREAAEATGMLQGRSGVARRQNLEAIFSKARQRDGMRAFEKLTAVVDGRRVIVEDPPVVVHVDTRRRGALEKVFTDYRATMPENRRDFLERYRFVDFALKVVGVGSVGTRCFILVLQGRDESDPLILQAKEATASVLEPYLQPSLHDHHGQRVVVGQQLMQGTSDIFLGWTRGPGGRGFYLRQLWDMKGSVDTAILQPPGLALLRQHLRPGPRTGPRPDRRRRGDHGLPRHLRHVRRGDRRLRGGVRGRERPRPRRVPGRDRGRAGVGTGGGLTRPGRASSRPGGRVPGQEGVSLPGSMFERSRTASTTSPGRRWASPGTGAVLPRAFRWWSLVRARSRSSLVSGVGTASSPVGASVMASSPARWSTRPQRNTSG